MPYSKGLTLSSGEKLGSGLFYKCTAYCSCFVIKPVLFLSVVKVCCGACPVAKAPQAWWQLLGGNVISWKNKRAKKWYFFCLLPEHNLLYFSFLGSENNSLYLYYKGLSKTLLTFKFDTVKSVLDKDRKEDDTNEFVSAVCWRALPDGVSFLLTHTAGCWKDASWFHSKWHCWGFGCAWYFPVHGCCRPAIRKWRLRDDWSAVSCRERMLGDKKLLWPDVLHPWLWIPLLL